MQADQVDEIIKSLNVIEHFLREDIIKISFSGATFLDPQRDFKVLTTAIAALRSFGFYYSEQQIATLENLISNTQNGVNNFLEVLRTSLQQKETVKGFDESAAVRQLNATLKEAQSTFRTDALRFKSELTSPASVERRKIISGQGPIKRSLFICYRRADSHWVVDRIYRQLRASFDSVFRDLDSIPFGVPFPEAIQTALRDVHSVLVVIGPTWLERGGNGRSRLFDADDHVRIEIETALKSAGKVVPILLSPAKMPAADEIPQSIRKLLEMNGLQLRPDPDFDADMHRLMKQLAQ